MGLPVPPLDALSRVAQWTTRRHNAIIEPDGSIMPFRGEAVVLSLPDRRGFQVVEWEEIVKNAYGVGIEKGILTLPERQRITQQQTRQRSEFWH